VKAARLLIVIGLYDASILLLAAYFKIIVGHFNDFHNILEMRVAARPSRMGTSLFMC
jgi:hypothetical protein